VTSDCEVSTSMAEGEKAVAKELSVSASLTNERGRDDVLPVQASMAKLSSVSIEQ
jgi:hypothetical protein